MGALGGEVLIAAPASSSAGDDDGVSGTGEVVDEFAGGIIEKQRADRDLEGRGLPCLAGTIGSRDRVRRARLCVPGLKRKCTRVLWDREDDIRTSPP